MPRLPVDIDLTYLPVLHRDESLAAIDAAMKRVAERVRRGILRTQITKPVLQPEKAVTKLLIWADGAQIKIEVTPVLRGCAYEPELCTISPAVEEAFGFANRSFHQMTRFYSLSRPLFLHPLTFALTDPARRSRLSAICGAATPRQWRNRATSHFASASTHR